MKISKKNNAFTLIELLVVIAIMGILIAVVVAAVGQSRVSANDKSIITSMNSLREGGDLWYNSTGTYAGFCGAGCSSGSTDWQRVCASVLVKGGTLACNISDTAWVASSSLPGGGIYCVDSEKSTGSISPGLGYTCPQ